jgi:hypothetical protein
MLAKVLQVPGEEKHDLSASRFHLGPTMLPFVFPFPNLIYTHVSWEGFFPKECQKFGSLLITDTTAANGENG